MQDGEGLFGTEVSDAWIADAVDMLPCEVVVLPEALSGEVGVYRDETITLAKALREAGVDAGYFHGTDNRTWSGRKGDPLLVPIVIALAANVVTGVAFLALSQWLDRTFPRTSVRVRVVRKASNGGKRTTDVFKAKGPGPDVAELLRTFETESDDG